MQAMLAVHGPTLVMAKYIKKNNNDTLIHTHTHTHTYIHKYIQVTYDDERTPTRDLIAAMLAIHDPTLVRAVGPHERGTGQYRSCIWVTNYQQEHDAMHAIAECAASLGKGIATDVLHMVCEKGGFYDAEDEHQNREGFVQVASSRKEWLLLYGTRKESAWGGINS